MIRLPFLKEQYSEERQKALLLVIGIILIVMFSLGIPYLWQSFQQPQFLPTQLIHNISFSSSKSSGAKIKWVNLSSSFKNFESEIKNTINYLQQKTKSGYDWQKISTEHYLFEIQSAEPQPLFLSSATWRESVAKLTQLDYEINQLLAIYQIPPQTQKQAQSIAATPLSSFPEPPEPQDWRKMSEKVALLEHERGKLLSLLFGQQAEITTTSSDSPPPVKQSPTWQTVAQTILDLEKSLLSLTATEKAQEQPLPEIETLPSESEKTKGILPRQKQVNG